MEYFDFIVIGSGIAGLSFSLNVAKKGKVLIITKKEVIDSTTNYAQGGIAAAIGELDDFEKHIKDTLEAGAYHNKLSAVEFMVKNGPKYIEELKNIGVPFTLTSEELSLTQEGGHSQKRIIYAGDHTGNSIETTLVNAVKSNKNITVWENVFAIDLLVKNQTCYGLSILKNKKIQHIYSSYIIMATGGVGQIYKYTTNPKISTGDGIAMAHRAGAKTKDLEFIQFHPTALNLPHRQKFLISEALRGEGAYLLNHEGKRFMQKYSPKKELASRDIVSRAISIEEESGKVYLDITHKDKTFVKNRFPQIYKKLKKIGIDITKDIIPITSAAHYMCGGVVVNLKGETNIKNLYAFGETACTGVHGANRLASNSLLEAIVFSSEIAKRLKAKPKQNKFPEFPILKTVVCRNTAKNLSYTKRLIKEIMWKNVGLVRTTGGLKKAILKLEKLKQDFKFYTCSDTELELKNILDTATLITRAALKRHNSLGCHYIR
ncbi:L-aspartate oxidase [Patescibacteria group bacterium]|nr:L-aspartate oxidase [Patescibacteria group bacterium]